MKKRSNNFPRRQSPQEIIQEARKQFSQKQKKIAKREQPPKAAKRLTPAQQAAARLNSKFDYAGTKLKVGSEKIAMYLFPLLLNLSGQQNFGKTGTTQHFDYFEIDADYNGDPRTLFKHVKFKELPENIPTVSRFVEKLEEDPHMTPQQYAQYEKQYKHQRYQTLTGNLSLQNTEILEQIMNSSAAWHLAVRGAYDSEQQKERWVELYHAMDEAQKTNNGIFDWAVSQIENEKHSIDYIINAIDDEIRLSLAGKYSRRRKSY